MAYKYKYLRVARSPYKNGEFVAQVNVTLLNKNGVNQKWDELDKTFPPGEYTSCLTECNYPMREFQNPPNPIKS